ncbi:glycoside hydrolase family 13 protein [Clostridium beijerinckii]|uniref:Alpha-glycosidase n=1 Tax=Clostridium beijerinckii TaxID=1520 RepID=A0A7X9SM25_CLOBE|nr:glycoside hydrolase family 13 protein [Clostridium beijerinckii]NMF04386.1 alpha-glycosidase [Clostridium beijerinckii]
MNKHAIYHILDTPYAYAKDIDTLSVTLRAAKNDIKICNIHYKSRYDWENSFNIKKMKIKDTNNLFDFFSTDISIERNRYRYFFELIDNEGNRFFLDERGLRGEEIRRKEATAFQYPYIAKPDVYNEEKWLQEAIVYQIFVDRFCNGDKSNDPENVAKWGSEVNETSMFGGDIQGIINKLDYLEDLGVNLLYLTPIFKSSSNHKYNTADYYKIDSQLGNIENVKELVKKCHDKNIKVVFDAVFNHSGADFFAFEDVLLNQEKSKYKDWYFIDSFPVNLEEVNYYTFADNVATMPKFNTHNEEVKNYLLNVAKYWIDEMGIDGWRLDVCDEVDHSFWRDFKKAVKNHKKEAIVIGEIMHEASSFLKGDQLDGIMNYPFKGALVDFFGNRTIDAKMFSEILSINRNIYMDSITRQMWNLIGSHDTQRFLTECGEKIERMKLAIVFQFTYIGVPYIYYGDEVGLNGGEEPQSRKCMIWNQENQNNELLNFYKKFILIRKNNKVLVYGTFKVLYCKGNNIVFEREYKNKKVIVAINNDYESSIISIRINAEVQDIFTLESSFIGTKMYLGPMEFKLYRIVG